MGSPGVFYFPFAKQLPFARLAHHAEVSFDTNIRHTQIPPRYLRIVAKSDVSSERSNQPSGFENRLTELPAALKQIQPVLTKFRGCTTSKSLEVARPTQHFSPFDSPSFGELPKGFLPSNNDWPATPNAIIACCEAILKP